MKKGALDSLANYRQCPQIILANAPAGAALSVPFTVPGDKLWVPEQELEAVQTIRTLMQLLGLNCVERTNVVAYGNNSFVSDKKNAQPDMLVIPACYGSQATARSAQLGTKMEIAPKVSNSITALHIEDITKVPVSNMREARRVANYLVALIPNCQGLTITSADGSEFETMSFQEFQTLMDSLLVDGQTCFVGASKKMGSMKRDASMLVSITANSATDTLYTVLDSSRAHVTVNRVIDKSYVIPPMLKHTAHQLRTRGYRGLATIGSATTDRGDTIPAAINTGLNPTITAAFTAAKLAKSGFAISGWGVTKQAVYGSFNEAVEVLHKKRLLLKKGEKEGVVLLNLPTGDKPDLHCLVVSDKPADLVARVQRTLR